MMKEISYVILYILGKQNLIDHRTNLARPVTFVSQYMRMLDQANHLIFSICTRNHEVVVFYNTSSLVIVPHKIGPVSGYMSKENIISWYHFYSCDSDQNSELSSLIGQQILKKSILKTKLERNPFSFNLRKPSCRLFPSQARFTREKLLIFTSMPVYPAKL